MPTNAPSIVIPASQSTRVSTACSRKVSTPKFPGYNPLIHLRTSELPPPGTASGQRPTTSNPITHEVDELRPATSLPASRAGSRGGLFGRLADPQRASSSGPGAVGSNVAQVLFVDGPPPATAGGEGRPPGTAGSGAVPPPLKADDATIAFAVQHPDRIRLITWPPPSPYTQEEILQDDLALR